MAQWLSAPQLSPFCPHPGQSCHRPTPAWDLTKTPIATDLQAEPPSSQIYLLPSTPWASAPPPHACPHPTLNP